MVQFPVHLWSLLFLQLPFPSRIDISPVITYNPYGWYVRISTNNNRRHFLVKSCKSGKHCSKVSYCWSNTLIESTFDSFADKLCIFWQTIFTALLLSKRPLSLLLTDALSWGQSFNSHYLLSKFCHPMPILSVLSFIW